MYFPRKYVLLAIFLIGFLYLFIDIIFSIKATATRFGYADMPIFLEAAQRYLHDGVLYSKSLEDYGPGTPVYKYPPILAAFLLPLAGFDHVNVLNGMLIALTIIFLAAAIFCAYILKPQKSVVMYAFFMTPLILNFSPFFETLLGLQLEITIFILLTICLFFIHTKNYFFAGAAIGVAAGLKIYPIIMMLYFCFRFQKSAWAGFIFTILILAVFVLSVFGVDINWWYFFEALPVLLNEPVLIDPENANIASLVIYLNLLDYDQGLLFSGGIICLGMLLFARIYLRSIRRNIKIENINIEYSLIIILMLMSIKNSWVNYQLLLFFPFAILVSFGIDHENKRVLLIVIFAFIMTVFTGNAGFNDFYFFPRSWYGEMVLYRGCVPIVLAAALYAALLQLQRSINAASGHKIH